MSDYDTDAARRALEAAFDSEGGSEQAPSEQESVTSEVEQTQRATETEPDTFTNIDPSTLAPELQTIYKQMQGDYTRKTQGVSQRERELNAFGGVDEVRNAVEFVHALRDPDNLVQLHGELSEYLQANGLSRAEADAVATEEVNRQANSNDEEWGYSDPDDDLRRELQELKNQHQELLTWRQEQEEQRQLAQFEQDIARKEAYIRNNNPSYGQSDIDRIYMLSYAFGGDLIQAQAAYEDQRRDWATQYRDSKSSVPSSLSPITPDGGAQAPESFGRDLDAAHEYAKRRAFAEMNQFS